ncbi:M28 family peptidase [Streptomyces sp. NPDC059740]|uniref:M28 family peptidase n=1 Tax=Streptomyces sp. NPDC059740 TaxID=3346926 RepID=UPI003659EDBC
MRKILASGRGVAAAAALLVAFTAPAAAGAPVSAPPAAGGPATGTLADRLAREVTAASVLPHLTAFQNIADANGGNRGYAGPGFTASADYVAGKLTAAGYRVTRQAVPYTDFAVRRESLSVTDAATGSSREVRTFMVRRSPQTDAAGLSAPVVALPEGRTGCSAADYAGLPVAGSVVLMPRDACGWGGQQAAAAAAGARAVVLWYPTPVPGNIYRLQAMASLSLPVATVSQSDGERLARQARAGATGVRLTLRGEEVSRTTENLLAETSGGDPDHVVMAGAHLDSVPEGPGINDNGSTAAAVLQTALALAPQQSRVREKVRFAFWGAEELVDVGSGYYVSHLSDAAKARISVLLNGELIASPNAGRFVWDSPGGFGHEAADLLAGYFDRRGLPYQRVTPENVGSDHLVFKEAGVAVAGLDGGNLQVKTAEQAALFGGRAGEMFDSCYHQACDRLANLGTGALDTNSAALAYLVGALAQR